MSLVSPGGQRRAIFLDRDGVLNAAIVQNGHPMSPRCLEDFHLVPRAAELLERCRQAGFLLCVITNQPELARGYIAWPLLESMHAILRKELPLDDILVCPHDDADACGCRKPQPGLLLQAAERWNIALRDSFVIGDTWRDMVAGRAVGCQTALLEAGYNRAVEADFSGDSLAAVVEQILACPAWRSVVAVARGDVRIP